MESKLPKDRPGWLAGEGITETVRKDRVGTVESLLGTFGRIEI